MQEDWLSMLFLQFVFFLNFFVFTLKIRLTQLIFRSILVIWVFLWAALKLEPNSGEIT